MQIYHDSKVYILCPGNYHTGGVELLHQLCSELIKFNIEAYMHYLPISSDFNAANPVDEFYKKYHINYTNTIIDDERNILIVYECATEYIYRFKNIRHILWWLSVDNYISHIRNLMQSLIDTASYFPVPKFFYFNEEDNDNDIEHWVQSEYAHQFVLLNGIPEERIHFVEDYINQTFINKMSEINLDKKEDIVVFNPKKGFNVTQQLMLLEPNINWQPIQNMTPEQVQQLLKRAKVYIDFGNHPGKDRIPREAAISGCVIITGKRGSAKNDIDINIPIEFKFDEQQIDYKDVINKIKEIFSDFKTSYHKQNDYRQRVMNDKVRFNNEIIDSLNIPPPGYFHAA